MSKLEIMAELPRLSRQDRAEILGRLWLLEEAGGPSDFEQSTLDAAQTAFEVDGDAGAPWSEVEARLRGHS